MCASNSSSTNVLRLYRGLLKAVKYYPSKRREGLSIAIKQDFRAKKDIYGEQLEKALWLGQMELKRLQTWIPAGKQVKDGGDIDIKL